MLLGVPLEMVHGTRRIGTLYLISIAAGETVVYSLFYLFSLLGYNLFNAASCRNKLHVKRWGL